MPSLPEPSSAPAAGAVVVELDRARPRSAAQPARRKRLLLCVHSATAGGAERMALAEAEYLEQHFELVISIPDGPLRPAFARHGELVEPTTSLPLWGDSARRWLGRSARTISRANRLAGVIRSRGIDGVLTSSSVLLAPVLAARLAGVPVIVHARDVPGSRLSGAVFRIEGRLATSVIVISKGLVPAFRTNRGARIIRIPDGIELPEPPELPPPGAAAFHDPLRLCVVGGVHPRKGQDIAVQALAHLRERGLDARLDIVGRVIDEPFAMHVRRTAEDLGLAGSVRFVGELDDVRPHLLGIDVLLAPSRGEWTPLALMEAMALRRPVVAASVGGVPEVIRDRDTGRLVAPEDPELLADAIAEIVADPSASAQMARRGRESIVAGFSIDSTLAALERELRCLMSSPA